MLFVDKDPTEELTTYKGTLFNVKKEIETEARAGIGGKIENESAANEISTEVLQKAIKKRKKQRRRDHSRDSGSTVGKTNRSTRRKFERYYARTFSSTKVPRKQQQFSPREMGVQVQTDRVFDHNKETGGISVVAEIKCESFQTTFVKDRHPLPT